MPYVFFFFFWWGVGKRIGFLSSGYSKCYPYDLLSIFNKNHKFFNTVVARFLDSLTKNIYTNK